jgi:hypothetical protein
MWTLVFAGVGFGQTMATIALPDTSAAFGDTVFIPITVSTDSTVGLAQFVVEFDSTIIQPQNAVIGKDIPNFVVSLNADLPFPASASGSNDNILVQVSGGGTGSFNGSGKEVLKLKCAVVDSSRMTSLTFDQTINHTFLTTTGLRDIAGGNIDFVDGSLNVVLTDIQWPEQTIAPVSFLLYQNYPNPFNPGTRIRFGLPHSVGVIIRVFNLIGQEVRTLVDQKKPAGYFEMVWDGKDNHGYRVSSGVFLCQMQAGDFIQIRKMLLLQ